MIILHSQNYILFMFFAVLMVILKLRKEKATEERLCSAMLILEMRSFVKSGSPEYIYICIK